MARKSKHHEPFPMEKEIGMGRPRPGPGGPIKLSDVRKALKGVGKGGRKKTSKA